MNTKFKCDFPVTMFVRLSTHPSMQSNDPVSSVNLIMLITRVKSSLI